uniref:C-type lectin domain-containing protein n=1 Tax=Sander lucioperca TaxID=283035 RepID=A0A8C9Y162_SANLU
NFVQTLQNTPCCPPGWRMYMSTCYQRSSLTNNWKSAKQDCEIKGSHLVILNDEEEERFVHRFGGAVSMWMGLKCCKDSNNSWTCKWVDGSLVLYR